MKRLEKQLGLAGLALALSASASAAQEVRCLLREGDFLPGVPGHTVMSLSNTAVNSLGGWACSVNSTDGVTTLSHAWGTAGPVAGAPLQSEGTFAPFEQTSWESFFGIDDAGEVAYSPTCNDLVGGGTGLDSVWVGDTPLAVEGLPIPSMPGKVWRYASRPGLTRDGQPFWAGGMNDGATGTNEGEALFFGFGATPLYATGDVPPGAPAAIDASGIDFDYAFSAHGTHHLTGVELGITTSMDYLVVMDGAALTIAGAVVQEGTPVPVAAGGIGGENWGTFDFFGVNEVGDWFFTGDTGGATATDEFVLRNGVILWREGDVLDGRTLTGAIEGASMNENGEIAFVWDVVEGTSSLEALYFEDRLVLLEGDTVDFDGDGIPDPPARIANFTGIAAVTTGPNRVVYLMADVDLLGTSTSSDDVECFLAVTAPGTPDFVAAPTALSAAAGGAHVLFLDAGDALAGHLYLVLGTLSGTAPGFPFGGFTVPLNPDEYFAITVNQPNVPPLVGTLALLDGEGRAVAQLQVPPGLSQLVGLTANHAYAVADPLNGVVEHVSATTALTFLP